MSQVVYIIDTEKWNSLSAELIVRMNVTNSIIIPISKEVLIGSIISECFINPTPGV